MYLSLTKRIICLALIEFTYRLASNFANITLRTVSLAMIQLPHESSHIHPNLACACTLHFELFCSAKSLVY